MKRVMFLMVSLMMIFSLGAQDRDQDKDRVQLRDHIVCEDGTVLQIKDQDLIRLRDQIRLLDGTIVFADASYQTPNGDRIQLRNGECLDFDGNKYVNEAQFQNHLQYRTMAANQLHYMLQEGKLYRVQNQEQIQVQQQVKLEAGGTLNPDGVYRLKNQDKMRLRDGECLDPIGNLYNNQAQFRNHAQLQQQAMAQEHYVFKNGSMYRIMNQQQSQIQAQLNLHNGISIFADGSFQLRDQDRIQLRDGECIDPDGNFYASQEQFRNQAHIRLQAMNQEHYVYENGQMYVVQNQERTQLRQQFTTQDGTVVNPDGTFQIRNQVQARLNNGECLDIAGNRYENQELYQQQNQLRLMAMAEPHFKYQNGKVYQTQNQVQVQVHERWMLTNGIIVNPDGSYQLKDGKREQMRNGEYLDWEGKRYENRDRFIEKMELRVQDRNQMREKDKSERRIMSESRKRIG